MARLKTRYIRTNIDSEVSRAVKAISDYDVEVKRKIEDAIHDTTEKIADGAKSRIHSRTGALKRSIKTAYSDEKGYTGTVKAQSNVAHLVEFGTKKGSVIEPYRSKRVAKPRKALHIKGVGKEFYGRVVVPARKAQPFMKPAAEQEMPNFERKVKEAIEKK